MGRKKKRVNRLIFSDIIYKNLDVEKFINILMVSGKKSIARNIFYKALNYIKIYYKKNPIKIFSSALDNCAPLTEPSIIKKGYKNFKNNFREIKKNRRKSLSMRWVVKFSRLRREKYMYLRLANEIWEASKKKGESFKKRELFHKMIDSKRNYKRKKKNV